MTTQHDERAELPPLPEGKAVVRGPVSAFNDPESGTLVDFDCEGPLSYDPDDGEELFTADQMREYARAALLAADGQAGGEVVAYQYRWLNPANNYAEPPSMLEWKPVEVRNTYTDTIEERVRELKAYRYDGKPVYEVRALYAISKHDRQVCGACGKPWDGQKCPQSLNGWDFPVCYPVPDTNPQQAAQVAQPLTTASKRISHEL